MAGPDGRPGARFRVLAADTWGAGRSPAWPADRRVSLHDEVALLEPVLALYEPTLFSLLDAESPPPNDADGIRRAAAAAAAALEAGDVDGAARSFVDHWSGPGSWDRTPEARRAPIAASVAHVGGWGDALFGEPAPLAAFSRLEIPVLLLVGTESPASSRGVARLLAPALPRVELVELEGLGHMGPVTHPEIVNRAIARFLERVRAPRDADRPRATG